MPRRRPNLSPTEVAAKKAADTKAAEALAWQRYHKRVADAAKRRLAEEKRARQITAAKKAADNKLISGFRASIAANRALISDAKRRREEQKKLQAEQAKERERLRIIKTQADKARNALLIAQAKAKYKKLKELALTKPVLRSKKGITVKVTFKGRGSGSTGRGSGSRRRPDVYT